MNWSTAHQSTMTPTLFISAGEASGEHYGALLASELRRQFADAGLNAEFVGMGGPRMAAAGVKLIVRAEDMAVMGLTEVVLHLPRIYREFRKLKRDLRAHPPTVAVLIDFPEINFRLAKEFHRLGVPVIYFVSPQLWAWKQHRIRLVREYVRRMLVIFPFEEAYYRARGVDAEFVGHPLADLPQPSITRRDFARLASQINQDQWNYWPYPSDGYPVGTRPLDGKIHYELNPDKEWIALLPGSRVWEIITNLKGLVDAAALLGSAYEYIIPLAPTLTEKQVARIQYELGDWMLPEKPPRITFVPDARASLFHARASVVASGTATVEAALIGNPFVVVYRVSPLTYAIARRMVKVPHVAMANLIAGKRVVPELIQHDFTAANIAEQLSPLLPDGPARESMRIELGAIRHALRAHAGNQRGQNAIERVAAIVVQEVEALSAAPAHAVTP
jgi:lipid-A-disaccharide synthase